MTDTVSYDQIEVKPRMRLLQSDRWRLWLDPACGVQWMAAEVRQEGRWVSVVADCRASGENLDASAPAAQRVSTPRSGQDETAPLAAANFHMIPYSNRIRDGRFRFNDQDIQLAEGEAHAIHGALRKLAWRVKSDTDSELVCAYSAPADGSVNWPWPMTTEIHYAVKENTISSTIRVRNDGDTSMPVGFGWHPYFVRTIDGESPEIQLPVNGVYSDTHGDCLPTGPSRALPPTLDFRHSRLLDQTQRIDHCFSGLDGPVTITWPRTKISLKMQASENCGHLVLFNPDKPHFAIEPVTNANDGFNLSMQGIDSGVLTLAPGDWASGDFSLTIE